MKPWLFPLILIVLDVLAAGCYGCNGDWRKLIYWLSAAVLNGERDVLVKPKHRPIRKTGVPNDKRATD